MSAWARPGWRQTSPKGSSRSLSVLTCSSHAAPTCRSTPRARSSSRTTGSPWNTPRHAPSTAGIRPTTWVAARGRGRGAGAAGGRRAALVATATDWPQSRGDAEKPIRAALASGLPRSAEGPRLTTEMRSPPGPPPRRRAARLDAAETTCVAASHRRMRRTSRWSVPRAGGARRREARSPPRSGPPRSIPPTTARSGSCVGARGRPHRTRRSSN